VEAPTTKHQQESALDPMPSSAPHANKNMERECCAKGRCTPLSVSPTRGVHEQDHFPRPHGSCSQSGFARHRRVNPRMPPPPRPRQAAPRAGRARWGCQSERRQNWCRAGRAARTYSPRPRWRPRPLHSCGSGPARCSRRLCLRGTGWRVRWPPPPASGRSSRPHHRSAALAKQTTGR